MDKGRRRAAPGAYRFSRLPPPLARLWRITLKTLVSNQLSSHTKMLQTMSMQIPAPVEPQAMSQLDLELANLLNSLSLQQQKERVVIVNEASVPTPTPEPDVAMADEQISQATSASSPSSDVRHSPSPCALLQAITGLYDESDADLENFPTTCGAYLELIFTHREAFAAAPHAHEGCPAGFTALARTLELRAWRADRDADIEAVNAFRHEAWMVAAWMSSGGMWWGKKEGQA
ncbi:hypothetical protein FA95DRAFT_1564203 [Auriscalpium vulgare]|uniref:Uncharacterized protein n=1 Tax=Auriscalpium vulgare TaxID=40419 RepID=A0ACB8RG17_9AGAM|nr:hypothetical protein FA95DRAFT_1564203 [Auriscalpium vulgare]